MIPRVAILVLAGASSAAALTHDLDNKAGGAGDCKCLSWKKVYDGSANVLFSSKPPQCGEMFAAANNGTKMETVLRSRFCGQFEEKLNDNICLKVDVTKGNGHWAEGSWCYVRNTPYCKEGVVPGHFEKGKWIKAGGAMASNPDVRPKLCTEGKNAFSGDKILKFKNVHEAFQWAKKKDVHLGVALRSVMKVSSGGPHHTWLNAKALLNLSLPMPLQEQVWRLKGARVTDNGYGAMILNEARRKGMTTEEYKKGMVRMKVELENAIQDIKASGRATILPGFGGEPWGIIHHDKYFEVVENGVSDVHIRCLANCGLEESLMKW